MSYIVVCRLNQIAETAAFHGAREMVSLLAQNQSFDRPGVIDENRHLKLALNDIAESRPGLTAPGEAHVERLINFARTWDQRAPLVVHCWLGISRSPAAAAITALTVEPDQDDMALAERLRAASPFVTPNARLIEIGDCMLNRGGNLVRAIKAIGRGADTFEGGEFPFAVRTGDLLPETGALRLRTGPAGRD
ncbi:tyrosine phosphatase family protein [Hoeflea sp. YIM 152468]|uniref:tyrosine phosphatase family protein n=1 Tax=Hoeflea sp. YIM 152468 TaxID=3031759 RepID=UPI0023DC67F6|nr:tyrosine phosphatase family protein [Hoeflea sp. YIM 152468]MDF1607749.1 tyrosine phosphatase family protein [Hoeflea sp. YIM 152468]